MLLPFSAPKPKSPIPKWNTGYYYGSPGYGTTTRLCTDQELQAAPIFIPQAVTLTSISINCTTLGGTGSVVRLGIYKDNAGRPGALLLDAGTVSTNTTGTKTITISQAVSPGLYWLAACAQGTPSPNPTAESMNGGLALLGGPNPLAGTYLRACWSQYGVTGALPDPFTGTGLDAGDFIYVQVGI